MYMFLPRALCKGHLLPRGWKLECTHPSNDEFHLGIYDIFCEATFASGTRCALWYLLEVALLLRHDLSAASNLQLRTEFPSSFSFIFFSSEEFGLPKAGVPPPLKRLFRHHHPTT
eukprot:6479863-Amphidinium_carterae.1